MKCGFRGKARRFRVGAVGGLHGVSGSGTALWDRAVGGRPGASGRGKALWDEGGGPRLCTSAGAPGQNGSSAGAEAVSGGGGWRSTSASDFASAPGLPGGWGTNILHAAPTACNSFEGNDRGRHKIRGRRVGFITARVWLKQGGKTAQKRSGYFGK